MGAWIFGGQQEGGSGHEIAKQHTFDPCRVYVILGELYPEWPIFLVVSMVFKLWPKLDRQVCPLRQEIVLI